MNKKVYVKQDGSIPGHRIIEELERRNIANISNFDGGRRGYYSSRKVLKDYIIERNDFSSCNGLTELLYNKETDSFCENGIPEIVDEHFHEMLDKVNPNPLNTEKIEIPKGKTFITEGVYAIPDGYEARAEEGKVIIGKKTWKPKVGDFCWAVKMYTDAPELYICHIKLEAEEDLDFYTRGTLFPTDKEAEAFCDKLRTAIRPLFEERLKELVYE